MNKPVVRQKPKPPPYPRPVPHLVIDELPPRPEDLAWSAINGGGHYSDDEDGLQKEDVREQRAAKRRRIEACATAYLRGEPLYIMSAQLKGPFSKGWKSPWAKKGVHGTSGIAGKRPVEIPETTRKIPSSVDEQRAVPVRATTPEPGPFSHQSLQRETKEHPTTLEQAPSPFTSKRPRLPKESSPSVPKEVKERRVEEWLRTNDTFAKRSEVLVHSSPTPSSRPRKTPDQSKRRANIPGGSQSEPPMGPSPRGSPAETLLSLQLKTTPRLSKTQERIRQLSKDIHNIIAEPPANAPSELHDEVRRLARPNRSSKDVLDTSRAEFAILEVQKNKLETVPAHAHMSPFEFRKVLGKEKEQTTEPTLADNARTETERTMNQMEPIEGRQRQNSSCGIELDPKKSLPGLPNTETLAHDVKDTNQDIFVTAPPPEARPNVDGVKTSTLNPDTTPAESIVHQVGDVAMEKSLRRVVSTGVSEMSTLEMLPSAQPILERLPSASSATHEKFTSIKPMVSASDNADAQNGGRLGDQGEERTHGKGHNTQLDSSNVEREPEGPPPGDVTATTPKPTCDPVELNTQEMLANIEPFELSTVKPLGKGASRSTPATATKAVAEKKRKKASFAVDPSSVSSHGSIKDAMRAKVSKSLGSPPLFMFTKDDLDIEVSDEENGSQFKRSKPAHHTGKSKSVLKSTNHASPPSSLRRSKSLYSTDQERDGQQKNIALSRSAQNAEEGDHFDLDAAIDDLGSFLGTWDAEKEASSLDISL